jgi:serine/threonine protein phosphatase PrpC
MGLKLPSTPNWAIAALTHRGRVRAYNEDAISIGTHVLTGDMTAPLVIASPNDSCLLMIADGMGGHARGATASRAVLDYLVAAIDRLSDPASCAEVVQEANRHLFELMQKNPQALGMGTTLAGAILTANQLVTFNVGDSRSYLFSAGQLVQLSSDDVPEGESNHSGPRRSHAITQALGGSSRPVPIEPHISADSPLAAGETLLLCSDGLSDMVANQVISETLRTGEDPGRSVRKLTAKAFRAGARDNISLIVARRLGLPDLH